MRLSRIQSRLIAAGALTLFFVVGLFFMRDRDLPVKDTPPLGTPTTPAQPAMTAPVQETLAATPLATAAPVFSLKEFHRSQIENGKVVWQVDASSGSFDPIAKQATLVNAHLTTTEKDGSQLEITAGAAKLTLNGATLTQADAASGVDIKFQGKVELKTDQASINQETGDVRAPGLVTIRSDAMLITGEGLEGNLRKKEIKLLRRVATTVYPQNKRG